MKEKRAQVCWWCRGASSPVAPGPGAEQWGLSSRGGRAAKELSSSKDLLSRPSSFSTAFAKGGLSSASEAGMS